ncbi:MAG: HAMP domain-containing sensor histidine kinase [Actinomycetota bacterium]|nr:HAMP domain-containing sensor histidine kinase [Actinomycetota bacterium]
MVSQHREKRYPWFRRWLYSVRFKIALVSVLVVGIALFGASRVLLTTLRSQLHSSIINQTRTQEAAVVSLVSSGSIMNPLPLPRNEISVQVLDTNNQVIASTANIAGEPSALASLKSAISEVSYVPLPKGMLLSDPDESDHRAVMVTTVVGQPNGINLTVSNQPTGFTLNLNSSQESQGTQTSAAPAPQRVVTKTYHSVFRVVALESMATVDQSVMTVVKVISIAFPLLLGIVALLVILLTARSLKPVERISREVAAITGSNLHNRISVPPARDEIAGLAVTMNQMLERLDDSAERSRRFVADASHELRSPLSVIQTELEVGLLHPEAVDWQRTANDALDESRRMQRIVEDLLMLARADSGKILVHTLLPVDLDDLVLGEASRLRLSGTVAVDTRAVSGGRVTGDPHLLLRVVRNLSNNAARHAQSRVTFALHKDGGFVQLEVADDGRGVPEELREKIFERFTRLDEARSRDDGGSGLGLSIVRTIVEAHGGSVEVKENPDGSRGARFVVRIPTL